MKIIIRNEPADPVNAAGKACVWIVGDDGETTQTEYLEPGQQAEIEPNVSVTVAATEPARLDFFLCKKHGIITPLRFAPDWWTTDDGCPVSNHEEDGMCGGDIAPVFFDSFVKAVEALNRVHEAARAWHDDDSFQGDGDEWFETDAAFLNYIVAICKEVFDG